MTSERDTELRALLVTQVHNAPRRSQRRTVIVAAALAFMLGGGVVGGAISAAAAVQQHPSPVDASPSPSPQSDVAAVISQFLHGGHTVGALQTYKGSGPARIDLGPRPADATGIAVYLECQGTGSFAQTMGSDSWNSGSCAPGTGLGSSSVHVPSGSLVTVTPTEPFPFVLWAQWISVPAPTGPSAAQQSELADGIVTKAERNAALSRFTACMYGAGYAVTLDTTTPQLQYSSPNEADSSGVLDRCYDGELQQVEEAWESQTAR